MRSLNRLLLLCAFAALLVVPATASAVTPQIATNYHETCVLSDAGSVLCSGDNGSLSLGDATSGIRSVFAAGPALGSVTQLAAGERHVCALLADTTVKCWGDNASYQLAQGGVDTTDSATPLTVKDNANEPLTGITQIATQDDTTCARKSDGTAWCWGAGTSGQLGDGGSTNLSLATQVFGLTGVEKVVPGSSVTCAIITGGTVKCWGGDTYGSLGNGASGNSPTPVDLSGLTGVVDIGGGSDFSCALISDGTLKCWGADGNGEQGNGPGTTQNDSPATVPGLTGVTQLAVGYSSVCVLRNDSTVYCWGYNDEYETGMAPPSKVESPGQNVGATGAIALAQQWDETGCAMFRGGGIKCWGYNGYGETGIENLLSNVQTPTDVPNVDLVTLAYPGTPNVVGAAGKTKLDKKKKTYTLSPRLTTTPNLLVNPSEACAGATTASVKRTYYTYKRVGKKRKKVKKTKTYKKNGVLVASGNDCVSTAALKLSVKFFNGKKVKVTFTAAGNASLQPVSAIGSIKLPKVKVKKK